MTNYFSKEELSCKCDSLDCDKYNFNSVTLLRLNSVRGELGESMQVSSGYRCKEYNKLRGFTQTHATGQAVDIVCDREKAVKILKLALNAGFTGIGVKQKGNGRFLHLDDLERAKGRLRPNIWNY